MGDAAATLLSTAFATIVASIIAVVVGRSANRSSQEVNFNNSIMQLNQIAMQYPYLEDDIFCSEWLSKRKRQDEQYQRYDNYCCIVFNLIEQLWKFYDGDKKKIESMLAISELIIRHKYWWRLPSGIDENINGYDINFVNFIDTYINK